MPAQTTCAECRAPLPDGVTNVIGYPCPGCGSTRWTSRVTVEPVVFRASPAGFQWYARDFYEAYRKMKGGPRFSPARLTLLAQAVELAAKSLHVHQGKRDADLRKLGHDLERACDPAVLNSYRITIDTREAVELKRLSDLNKAKAFEYFWFPGSGGTPELTGFLHALSGRRDLPDEDIVEGLLVKLLEPKLL